MLEHADAERLSRSLKRCRRRTTAWSGVVYRSASPRYANQADLLTGAGSRTAGARWNPPNSFRTIYASLDPQTALEEALAHFRHYELSIAQAMPRVIVSLETQLQRVLNLTDGLTRRLLGVSQRRLLTEPWRHEQEGGREALTQAIGRLAHGARWEALLVASAARKRGLKLVIFPENLEVHGSWLRIINREQLPRRL